MDTKASSPLLSALFHAGIVFRNAVVHAILGGIGAAIIEAQQFGHAALLDTASHSKNTGWLGEDNRAQHENAEDRESQG